MAAYRYGMSNSVYTPGLDTIPAAGSETGFVIAGYLNDTGTNDGFVIVTDLAGNTTTWTSTAWGIDPDAPDFRYPYDPADGREDPDTDLAVLRTRGLENRVFVAAVNERFAAIIGPDVEPGRLADDACGGLRLSPARLAVRLDGAVVPGNQSKVQLTLTVPPIPTLDPVVLEMEGVSIGRSGAGKVARYAVPAESMMQAFFYWHLVPTKDWTVAVAGRSGRSGRRRRRGPPAGRRGRRRQTRACGRAGGQNCTRTGFFSSALSVAASSSACLNENTPAMMLLGNCSTAVL